MRAILALALIAAIAHAGVVTLTDATFNEVVKGEFVMVEFYAPWCGHCKKLDPEYTQAADQIGDLAVLAKIDATVDKVNAEKYEIKGFPTIKIFREGALVGDYEGGRTAADIVKYVKGNVGPAVKHLKDAASVAAFQAENSVAVIGNFAEIAGEKFHVFDTVAKSLRTSFAFASVTDASLFDGEEGSIVIYKNFDEKREIFQGTHDETSIKAFVKNAGTPLFDEIGPHNYKNYLERGLPISWLFATTADTAALDAARTAAATFKGKLSAVWIDSSKYAGMAQRLGLKGDKFPALAIDSDGQHFIYSGDLTADGIREFTQSFVDGKLEATVKSEEIPEPATVDGMTTVVGKTFKALVEESETDVFIEFYAPWCGHCKSLAPILDSVAKSLKDSPIVVAKIDATANDFNQKKFAVQGFPTMFYVSAKTHEPVPYEGGRTEEALLTFLKGKLAS